MFLCTNRKLRLITRYSSFIKETVLLVHENMSNILMYAQLFSTICNTSVEHRVDTNLIISFNNEVSNQHERT